MHKWKQYQKSILTVACTMILALVLSTLPTLLLALNDTLLLGTPQPRGTVLPNVVPSGDDFYLARAIKQKAARNGIGTITPGSGVPGGKETQFYLPQNTRYNMGKEQGIEFFMRQINILVDAGALPQSMTAAVDTILRQNNSFFYTSDESGFLHFHCVPNQPVDTNDDWVALQMESRTGKIVHYKVRLTDEISAIVPTSGTQWMQAYVKYLAMDTLDDWQQPEATPFAERGLYSLRAELIAYYDIVDGIYKSKFWQMHLLPFDEVQLVRWQVYNQAAN